MPHGARFVAKCAKARTNSDGIDVCLLYPLNHCWSDGTAAFVFEPEESVARMAALHRADTSSGITGSSPPPPRYALGSCDCPSTDDGIPTDDFTPTASGG
jgi:hypothetical protein